MGKIVRRAPVAIVIAYSTAAGSRERAIARWVVPLGTA
jgi:hypothetical protein